MSDEKKKLAVTEYPGPYTFRVVVEETIDVRIRVRTIVETVVGAPVPDHALVERRASGKYVTLHITAHLHSEEQRVGVYTELKAQPFVKFML